MKGAQAIRGVRAKVTIISLIAALCASIAIVVVAAASTYAVLENMVTNDLRDHLDKAERAVEVGNYALAVQYAGSDIMQVIAADGSVLMSSVNAEGLAAIVSEEDVDNVFEVNERKIREAPKDVDDDQDDEEKAKGDDDAQAEQQRAGTNAASAASSNTNSKSTKNTDRDDDDDRDDRDDSDDDYDDDDAGNKNASASGASASKSSKAATSSKSSKSSSASSASSNVSSGKKNSKAVATKARNDSDDSDDNDDNDDDDDDSDDDDGDGKRASSHKSKQNASNNAANNDDERDDDSDDDDADDDNDAGESEDEDGDDKGAKAASKSAKKAKASPVPPFVLVERAYADEGSSSGGAGSGGAGGAGDDEQGPFIEASEALGQPGPFLVMKRSVGAPDGMVTLAAMTSLRPALEATQTAAELLALVMGVLLLLVGVFSWFLAGRTLRPVEEMRASVAAIQADDLSARVSVPRGDRDLAPLALTFNELLDRIERSVDEQRRFVSDASHELKSPVAATGIMLEAMREYPDLMDSDQLVVDLTYENDRMAKIVGNLLVLARNDEGRTSVEMAPLDLFDVLHEEIVRLGTRTDVRIDTSGVDPVVCVSDRELVSHAVRNLLENAVKYAQSTVKLTCADMGEVVRITVSDDGCGIPPSDRERVFGRFVRLEAETERRAGSTGLGLSVVKSAVEQLGGTVRFVDGELGGATAVVELPADASEQ